MLLRGLRRVARASGVGGGVVGWAPGARSGGVGAFSPVRCLNLHEYESLELMQSYGIPTPVFSVASTPEEAESIYLEDMAGGKSADVVIKAQVLAGGRGLGYFDSGFQGGVHLVTRPGQAEEYASKMLGHRLITKQTGSDGRPCHKVLLAQRVYMRREMYFSLLYDRASGGPVMVASPRGGTSIEDVAESTPELILKEPVDLDSGPSPDQLQKVANFLGFHGDSAQSAANAIENLYKLFVEKDATLVEVNPLAETPSGDVLICDAKINFDDNAEFRQGEVFQRRDVTQEDPREVAASEFDLNYIGLDGDIGCMVNGAGLAMATMDIIKLNGGEPANFLDVGGGATETQVAAAFRILNNDKNVRAILVNIFGGIMRCDVIAAGIVAAAKEIGLSKPIVLRLQGTNVTEAKEVIEHSGFRMILEDDLDTAAKKAVRVSDIVRQANEIAVDVKFTLPL